MVGQVVEDGECAVELLGKDDAYHLVREGHAREGYLAVGCGVHGIGEAVRATDDED